MEQVNNINNLKKRFLDGSIPSTVADSGATLSIGTKRDSKRNAFVATGRRSDKAFRMPNGEVEKASNMDELHRKVRHPAKNVHIVLGIERDSLLSIPQFADATRTKSTSMMPTKQKLSSLGMQFYKDGNAIRQTCGKCPSSNTSTTTGHSSM